MYICIYNFELALLPGAYRLAWERAATPLKGELIHAWYMKTESPEPLQLPRYFNVPLELAMSQWMVLRKKWDGTLAKRAAEGKTLTLHLRRHTNPS